jgi:hypothetical protein
MSSFVICQSLRICFSFKAGQWVVSPGVASPGPSCPATDRGDLDDPRLVAVQMPA